MNPCRRTAALVPLRPVHARHTRIYEDSSGTSCACSRSGLGHQLRLRRTSNERPTGVCHASNCFGAYCVSSSWCSQYPREATGHCVLRCVSPSAALLAALPHTELTLSTVVPESVAITNCDATSPRSGYHLLRYELDQVTVNGRVAAR